MTFQGWILILAFVGILLAVTKPVGLWLFALYEGRRTPLHTLIGPVERASTGCRASIPMRSRAGAVTQSTC